MKNNSKEINNEFKKLKLHVSNPFSFQDDISLSDSKMNYGNLGIDKPDAVKEHISNTVRLSPSIGVSYTSSQKKLFKRAEKALNHFPKNSYAYNPRINEKGKTNIDDLKKIIHGKQPTAQTVASHYKNFLLTNRKQLNHFKHYSNHLLNLTQNHKLNNIQLGHSLHKLNKQELKNMNSHHTFDIQRQEHIESIEYISSVGYQHNMDNLFDGKDSTDKEKRITKEINNKLKDPKYTYIKAIGDVYNPYASKTFTGHNDFEPLNNDMVNHITTKMNSIANKKIKYFNSKLNIFNQKHQSHVLNKIGLKTPLNVKSSNKKHLNIKSQTINIKKHNKIQANPQMNHKNIEREPQI